MTNYVAPVTFPEAPLLQAREAVLAAAIAYVDVENDPKCGNTSKAAYWSQFTVALAGYADAHNNLYAPAPVPAKAEGKEVQDASTDRLMLLVTLALRAAHHAGLQPSEANKTYYRVAVENMQNYIRRIRNGLPRPSESAPIVSRETELCGAQVPLCVETGVHKPPCICVLRKGHANQHLSKD